MKRQKNDNRNPREKLAANLALEEDSHAFEWVWQELEEYEVADDIECGRLSKEEALWYGKRSLRRYHRAREESTYSSVQGEKQKQARRVQDIPVELTERERDVTEALRRYFAVHAARRPLVQRFRREDLPDSTLLTRDEDIGEFLAEALGVEADVEKYLRSNQDKPDRVDTFYLSYEQLDGFFHRPPDEVAAEFFANREREGERWLEERWERPLRWRLKKIAELLAGWYPWETVGDAVVFLVSGRPPRLVEPLSATHDERYLGYYSLTYLPWVSEETVVRAYRATQFSRRSPGEKTVRVLRFVSEQSDQEGGLPSWAELFNRWNAANPNERFYDRTSLYHAHRRALEALIPPYLPLT